jgi:hypothetical protein
MPRTLLVCALLAAVVPFSRAQEAPAPTETVVRLTVEPQAAPRAALKYQLLPELKDMEPGNPIFGYLKCFPEQQNFWYRKDAVENRDKWEKMPLGELPLQEMRHYGYLEGNPLQRAVDAARLMTPDWQILVPVRREGSHLMLPEVQQLRTLAAALKVRLRGQIAERHFDDALVTAQTLFALSRHLGEHPTLIGDLVGTAVAYLTLSPLEEMIQQPGCPNLYWALSELPDPLIDPRPGIQGDQFLLAVEFGYVDRTAPMSAAQLQRAVAHYVEMQKQTPNPVADVRDWLRARAQDEAHVRDARRRLVQAGLSEDLVKEFPALQVVLLDEQRAYVERRDAELKWLPLPYWQAEPGLLAAAAANPDERVFVRMLPALKVRKAQVRLEQRLALFRHVEALRVYAADHDGKLPARLGDVPVPLPVDPVTGKAFAYEVEGQTAVLHGTTPKGEEKDAAYNVRFVVTVKK